MIKIVIPIQLVILRKDLKIWRKVINSLYPNKNIIFQELIENEDFEKLLKTEMKVRTTKKPKMRDKEQEIICFDIIWKRDCIWSKTDTNCHYLEYEGNEYPALYQNVIFRYKYNVNDLEVATDPNVIGYDNELVYRSEKGLYYTFIVRKMGHSPSGLILSNDTKDNYMQYLNFIKDAFYSKQLFVKKKNKTTENNSQVSLGI